MKHRLVGKWSTREVWLNDQRLIPLGRHSPNGFNWGYGGSGPAELALAIVTEITGKPDGYQEFKWDVIARLPQTDFEIEFEL